MKLSGRTCLITGASGGLGRRLAEKFWSEGASLVLLGRDSARLRSAASFLRKQPREEQQLALVECDLRQLESLPGLIARTLDQFGPVTALVNNAAVLGPIGPLWENETRAWEEALRVNLLAPVALCRLVIPRMREAGYGKIVNLSGGGATGPRPFFSAYAASKAGLVRLTEVLACETRHMRIDVNCVAPGVMKTQMLDRILAEAPERIGADEDRRLRQLVERSDETFERATNLVLFLLSRESDGITGRLISAVWDPWEMIAEKRDLLEKSDIYTLRRIVPQDRGQNWTKA